MRSPSHLADATLLEAKDPEHGKVGIYAWDLTRDQEVATISADERFYLASLTKMFTAGASLEALGPSHVFRTHLLATGKVNRKGVLRGDLVIQGGGDPTLGRKTTVSKYYSGTGTSVEQIAQAVREANIQQIDGRILGHPHSTLDDCDGKSPDVPLIFDRAIDSKVTARASESLLDEIEGLRIFTRKESGTYLASRKLLHLTTVNSPSLSELLRVAGHESDNFLADVITRQLGVSSPSKRLYQIKAGAEMIENHCTDMGSTVSLVNGSGTKLLNSGNIQGNTGTPRDVVHYLTAARHHEWREAFTKTLPRAGQDGTLKYRMRNTLASHTVRAKTGTLTSQNKPLQDSLAGYCFGSDATIAFAIIFEGATSRYAARASIDRLTVLLAEYAQYGGQE